MEAYNYFKGEKENLYLSKGKLELDFQNPKSLFWYYEKFHFCYESTVDFKSYMENLIHNKLSEYIRSDYDLWKLYFENSVK